MCGVSFFVCPPCTLNEVGETNLRSCNWGIVLLCLYTRGQLLRQPWSLSFLTFEYFFLALFQLHIEHWGKAAHMHNPRKRTQDSITGESSSILAVELYGMALVPEIQTLPLLISGHLPPCCTWHRRTSSVGSCSDGGNEWHTLCAPWSTNYIWVQDSKATV